VDSFQNINIFSIEEIEFPVESLDILGQLLKALDHELYTVIWKVGVLLGIDLDGIENKYRGDLLKLFQLSDKCSVVYYSEVAVEEEEIH